MTPTRTATSKSTTKRQTGGPASAPGGRAASLLYKPWGLVAGMLGGLIATQIFQQVWKRIDPSNPDDPPKPLQSETRLRTVLLAAALQGAIFTVVRALITRGGARVFERWTGEWPGE